MANHDFPFEHFLTNNSPKEVVNHQFYKEDQKKDEQKTEESDEGFSKDELKFINNEVLSNLKNSITAQKFDTYFESNFTLMRISGESVSFSVATKFIKNIIENQFIEQLKLALQEVLGNKSFKVEIVVKQGQKNELTEKSINEPQTFINSLEHISEPTIGKGKSVKDNTFTLDLKPTHEDLVTSAESKYINHRDQEVGGSLIDPAKTFNNFIVGHSNQLAFATAIAVAKNPGKKGQYPSLYIHSNSGLGKTHLLHAVGNGIKENFPHLRICLITARNFLKEMVEYIKDNNIEQFQKKYSEKVDVLMIDDIHELKNKKGTQEEFFHIFNELYDKGKQLIFTSDKSPAEIDGIPERIRTRLQWGLVIDIQKPDIETRIAILKTKAYELDLTLSDDILTQIANCIKSNIRELEGSLIRLSAYSDMLKMDIDSELVKEILHLSKFEETEQPKLEDIAKITSAYFKIPLADMRSKARSKEIAKARHVAMYLSRKIIHATQQEIGKYFGGRDHTSVIHGVNKISREIKTDRLLAKDVIEIENNL